MGCKINGKSSKNHTGYSNGYDRAALTGYYDISSAAAKDGGQARSKNKANDGAVYNTTARQKESVGSIDGSKDD